MFTISPGNEKYDVLLFDITVNPLDSLKALGNVFPSLKRGGMLLQVLKLPEKTDIGPMLERLSLMGFEIIQIVEAQKNEAYLIVRKL